MTIDAGAPHMVVRQISGSFGKSSIIPAPGLATDELQRRSNRLQECREYVQWQAKRAAPGEVLVVTHKAIEAYFADIPGVNAAHFNAIAGLDCYKDVSILISIGRPLPASQEVEDLASIYFGTACTGAYEKALVGVHMREGSPRALRITRHTDVQAETLRAAICDDELIQVIGRGRGVNRTAKTPLEVHLLADVALPLIYDSIRSWSSERPSIFQRMLLAGLATDSPTDALKLHPNLFLSADQAKMQFRNTGLFKGQTPISNLYREMTLKSAAYRRLGRGHGWQRCWWIEGNAETVRGMLERRLGAQIDWRTSH